MTVYGRRVPSPLSQVYQFNILSSILPCFFFLFFFFFSFIIQVSLCFGLINIHGSKGLAVPIFQHFMLDYEILDISNVVQCWYQIILITFSVWNPWGWMKYFSWFWFIGLALWPNNWSLRFYLTSLWSLALKLNRCASFVHFT